MIELITKTIARVVGTKSERDIRVIKPYIEKAIEEYEKIHTISDDDLRQKTQEIKSIIDTRLQGFDERINANKQKAESDISLSLQEKENIFNEIDKLEEDRNKELEVVLNEVLPPAFAIVRETARRLKENGQLKVKATLHDKTIAARSPHVKIEDDYAIWQNQWMAAGNMITWDMVHFEVQLIGGVVLHHGKIAEMATGEGKTLVATLPAFLNALAKRGVHIVTVNDYLARRDSEWMGPIFEFHGLIVDCIDKHEPNSDARRKAYQADITYGTNNEFGFDYLRDNMAREVEDIVQRKHHFAMVDEVDSVLIDDARTPLIISGPIPRGDEHEFHLLKPRVQKLVDAQKKLCTQLLIDSKKLIGEPNEKDGGLALLRAHRGLPKHKPLIKYLSETGIRQVLQKTENYYLQDNAKLMPEVDKELFFTIEEKHNSIELTEKGIDLITGEGEDPQFFIMPDIGQVIAVLENDTSLSESEKLLKKEELIKDYTEKSKRIHTINQLLKAYTLFERDTEYIIIEGKVKIVDEQTGRVLEGRRYSDGLHQAIEAKENVKVEDATQTYATITLQNYFRMYHKLAGMTGTAETEAGEFWNIYKLDVVVIPTNVNVIRGDREDKVFKTTREKFNAVVEEIVELIRAGRPVLVGTTSVEISEILSRMLALKKIKHQVLNAKQHQKEAEIVAEAGKPGTVTIATNMAGRGTDIKLTPDSRGSGGLAILGTERHESRRVDRQLRGRSGRQGDPGTSQFFVSLEDNLMRLFGSERIAKIMDRLGLKEGEVIQHSLVTRSIERAQKKVEENNFSIRKRLLEYDDVMNSQRTVIYRRRSSALYGDRLQVDIMNMIYDTAEEIVSQAKLAGNAEAFKLNVIGTFGIDFHLDPGDLEHKEEKSMTQELFNAALQHYSQKNDAIRLRSIPIVKDIFKTRGATVEEILVPFTDGLKQIGIASNLKKNVESDCRHLILSLEKNASLAFIDMAWKEHLREMDDLKQSVQNAVYEQKDPLLIYKFESFELFKQLVNKVNNDTISFLMKASIPIQEPDEVQEARRQRRARQQTRETKEESRSLLSGGGQKADPRNRPPVEKSEPVKSQKVAGRNDKVNVQYADGTIKRDVKYKKVEEDILNNKCVIID
ncbi:MAG TPA: preprotein translocase subunit SecA [Cyclobacteriaceae bacterium]|nr:preprotein translocase subunit SecA [Cyclobacteriaceae bacterium]